MMLKARNAVAERVKALHTCAYDHLTKSFSIKLQLRPGEKMMDSVTQATLWH